MKYTNHYFEVFNSFNFSPRISEAFFDLLHYRIIIPYVKLSKKHCHKGYLETLSCAFI